MTQIKATRVKKNQRIYEIACVFQNINVRPKGKETRVVQRCPSLRKRWSPITPTSRLPFRSRPTILSWSPNTASSSIKHGSLVVSILSYLNGRTPAKMLVDGGQCSENSKGLIEGCRYPYLGTGETQVEGRETKVELALRVVDDAGEMLSRRTVGATTCDAWWIVDTVYLRPRAAGELGGAWSRW